MLVNVTAVNNVAGSTPTYISLLTSPLALRQHHTGTSNVNVKVGQIRANLAIVPISADGSIWVYNHAGNAHVVVDVMGYFIADVRRHHDRAGDPAGLSVPRLRHREAAFTDQPLPPANAEDWSFTDFANDVKVAGAPVGPQLGLLGNLTAAALGRQYKWAPASSYVTAYPTPSGGGAQTPPLISNLNITEGEIVPNMVMLSYGCDGTDPNQVRFYNRAGYLDYLLDVTAVVLG